MSDVKPCLLTVMAGFVEGGRWTTLLLRWIRALRSVSNHLVLVFDQDDLSAPPELEADDGITFLAQRHRAYDFGSYRLGVQILNEQGWLDQAAHVLLCNDSVIGPFFDLNHVLQKMMADPNPVWGLTESYLYAPHLQSYFLLLDVGVLFNPSVYSFFEGVVPQRSRHDVIQCYELGFSELIKGLDLSYKAWMPAERMLDPRNGELMANPTAFPLCVLSDHFPVIKARALKETAANDDGLAKTCDALATQYPEIWSEVWEAFPNHRLWQEDMSISIVLSASDVDVLDERLGWIKSHPHPKLTCILPVHSSDFRLRARLVKDFRDDIAAGIFTPYVCNCNAMSDAALIQVLAAANTDWVVASSSALWSNVSSLLIQIRKALQKGVGSFLDGSPKLFRREALFDRVSLGTFRDEWG